MAIQQGTYATPRLDLASAFYEYYISQSGFAALHVLPVVKAQKRDATFSKITRESLLKRAATKRGPGGAYNRIDVYAEDDEYACKENGLEAGLGDDQRAFYETDFDAEEATTKTIWQKLMQEMEIRVAALVFNTSTWTGASLYTDNSGAPWDNVATNIIGQVIDATEKVRKNTGILPNSLTVSAATMANMLKNTGIKNQFPGATLVTLAMVKQAMPSIFGLEEIIVCGQVYDSAKEGQEFSGSDVWADDYAMVARVAKANDPILTPCIGRTMLWVTDSPDEITVEEYREEQTRADIFRARHHTDEKVFDANFGHLMLIDA